MSSSSRRATTSRSSRSRTSSPARLIASLRVDGWEHVADAYAQGKGVILASAHLGSVSFVGQIVLAHGLPVALPVEVETSDFQRAVNRARGRRGPAAHPDRLVARDLPRAPRGQGARHPGRPGRDRESASASSSSGAERCCRLPRSSSRCAPALHSLPSFAGRSDGVLTATFEPPLEMPKTGDRDADVREGVQRFARVLERYVRAAPEEWTVFEDFWRGTR